MSKISDDAFVIAIDKGGQFLDRIKILETENRRLHQRVVDLETTVAYNEATIADLEAEIKRLTETELALMEELEEAA